VARLMAELPRHAQDERPVAVAVADLTFTRSGEFDVVEVQSNTDAGTDFIDAYTSGDMSFVVVDSGRIVVATRNAPVVERTAQESGLTTNHEETL
jgi:ABC-type taurine transport system substrate-binding protein